jgi:hypothetical protein
MYFILVRKIFFYLQNQKLIFSFNFPFNLAAEPPSQGGGSEAETLTYPKWWTILKLARTIFASRFARGDGKAQKNLTARRELKNCQRT